VTKRQRIFGLLEQQKLHTKHMKPLRKKLTKMYPDKSNDWIDGYVVGFGISINVLPMLILKSLADAGKKRCPK
jgi:hypothetical protein